MFCSGLAQSSLLCSVLLLRLWQCSATEASSLDRSAAAQALQCLSGDEAHGGRDHQDDVDTSDLSLLHISSKVTVRKTPASSDKNPQTSTSGLTAESVQSPVEGQAVPASAEHAAARRPRSGSSKVATLSVSSDSSGAGGSSGGGGGGGGGGKNTGSSTAAKIGAGSPDEAGVSELLSKPAAPPRTSSLSIHQRVAHTFSGLLSFMPKPEHAPMVMLQTRIRHNRAQSGASTALHRVAETFSGLSAYIPRPEEAPMVMMQTRTRHNRTQSGASTLMHRVAATFDGLSAYMPNPEDAPAVMIQSRTKHNKSAISGPLEQMFESYSRLGSPMPQAGEAPHTMLQSKARRARVGSDLISLNSILTIILLLALIAFGLLLYHNNFNVEQTVQEFRSDPQQALRAAQAEGQQLYKTNFPQLQKTCC